MSLSSRALTGAVPYLPRLASGYLAASSFTRSFSSIRSRRTLWTMSHSTETRENGTTILLSPKDGHINSLMVVIHGLGDTAQGWENAARIWSRQFPSTRFILPTAKVQPVTVNMGAPMPSWYDIRTLDSSSKLEASVEGIEESAARIQQIISEQMAETGVEKKDIVLAGFSQGAAMSYWVGLQDDEGYAGVVAMSGYLPRAHSFNLSPSARKSTPVIHCHGDSDMMVNSNTAVATLNHLQQAGLDDVTLMIYPGMQHSVCGDEIRHIAVWLKLKAKLGLRGRSTSEVLESLTVRELHDAAAVFHVGGDVEDMGALRKSLLAALTPSSL